ARGNDRWRSGSGTAGAASHQSAEDGGGDQWQARTDPLLDSEPLHGLYPFAAEAGDRPDPSDSGAHGSHPLPLGGRPRLRWAHEMAEGRDTRAAAAIAQVQAPGPACKTPAARASDHGRDLVLGSAVAG